MKVISFTQLIKSFDLARACLGELHKISPQIGTLEKSVVEREPQQIFEAFFLWYQWLFSN